MGGRAQKLGRDHPSSEKYQESVPCSLHCPTRRCPPHLAWVPRHLDGLPEPPPRPSSRSTCPSWSRLMALGQTVEDRSERGRGGSILRAIGAASLKWCRSTKLFCSSGTEACELRLPALRFRRPRKALAQRLSSLSGPCPRPNSRRVMSHSPGGSRSRCQQAVSWLAEGRAPTAVCVLVSTS